MKLCEELFDWVENPHNGLVDYYDTVELYFDNIYNDEAEAKIQVLVSAMGDDAVNKYAHDYLDELYDEYDYDDDDGNPYDDTEFTCDTFVRDFYHDILDFSDMKDNIRNLADSPYCKYYYDDLFFMFGLDSSIISIMREEIEDLEEQLPNIDDPDIIEENTKRINELEKKIQQIREDKHKFDSKFVNQRKALRSNNKTKKSISYSDVESAAEEFAENKDYNVIFIERGYITSKGTLLSNDSIQIFMGTLDRGKTAADIRHGDADADFVKYLCGKLSCTSDDLFDAVGLSIHDAYGSADSLVGDKLNWIRVNAGFERYIALPQNKITVMQQQALTDWIDEFFLSNEYLHVTTNNGKQITYTPDDSNDDEFIDGDYIVKRIMKFYNSGNLLENTDKNDLHILDETIQSVFARLKSGLSTDDGLFSTLKPFLTDFLRSAKDDGNKFDLINVDGFLSTMQRYGFTVIKDKGSPIVNFTKDFSVPIVGKVNVNVNANTQGITADAKISDKNIRAKAISSILGLDDLLKNAKLSLTLSYPDGSSLGG